MCTIKKHGKDLSSINLLMNFPKFATNNELMIDYIIEGCPKLKTLKLESLADDSHDNDSDNWSLIISKKSLKALQKGCKELKDLKLNKVLFLNIFTEHGILPCTDDEIKKILPDCNVELGPIVEFDSESDDSSWMTDSDDSDDWSDDYDSNNSWDDGEQDT